MRAAPTLSYSAVTDFSNIGAGVANNVSTITATGASPYNTRLDFQTPSAGTAGWGAIVQTANANSILNFSAEL